MSRNINSGNLTKKYILSKVSQLSIFSTYLNIDPEIIENCIEYGELIKSPLREDVHPTCGFRYDNRGKLKFKDFAGYFWGDCFDVVALIISRLYNIEIDVNNKHDFIKILRHITLTFSNIFYGKDVDNKLINGISNTINRIKKDKPIIEIVTRNWNKQDETYWGQFGIDLRYLNVNYIYPVDQYYINRSINPKPKYYYDTDDPCYAYILGKDNSGIVNIKLYFPNRTKGTDVRFITNCNHLEGIYNLQNDCDAIVITKSTKDRLSLGATLYKMRSLYGGLANIGVINIPHETYKLREVEYNWLKSKLKDDGKLFSLMDNDHTGKLEAIYLNNQFEIIPMLIPAEYKCKDFAELRNRINQTDLFNLIKEHINNIDNYGCRIPNYIKRDTSFDIPY